MNVKQRIALLEYELEHLRWCERTQEKIASTFGLSIDEGIMLPCSDYKLLGLILDDLKVPNENRDEIYNMYYDLIIDPGEVPVTEEVKTFLLEISDFLYCKEDKDLDSLLEEIDDWEFGLEEGAL